MVLDYQMNRKCVVASDFFVFGFNGLINEKKKGFVVLLLLILCKGCVVQNQMNISSN